MLPRGYRTFFAVAATRPLDGLANFKVAAAAANLNGVQGAVPEIMSFVNHHHHGCVLLLYDVMLFFYG